MISEQEIREQIATYLSKQIDLDRLEDWIAQNTWNVHKWGDAQIQDLTHAVELVVAEHSNEDISEDELRSRLKFLAYQKPVQTSMADPNALAGISQGYVNPDLHREEPMSVSFDSPVNPFSTAAAI